MSFTFTARSRFPRIAGRLKTELQQAIDETARLVVTLARAAAPVDTGALRASIHYVSLKRNTYHGAVATAQSHRPGVQIFPEVRPQGDLEAVVAVGVNYGIFLEFGTRRARAQPYFFSAFYSARVFFERRTIAAIERAQA